MTYSHNEAGTYMDLMFGMIDLMKNKEDLKNA